MYVCVCVFSALSYTYIKVILDNFPLFLVVALAQVEILYLGVWAWAACFSMVFPFYIYFYVCHCIYTRIHYCYIVYSDDKNLEIKQVGVLQLMNINLWKLAKKKMYYTRRQHQIHNTHIYTSEQWICGESTYDNMQCTQA